jgi:hypothetical protein
LRFSPVILIGQKEMNECLKRSGFSFETVPVRKDI